MSDQGTGAAYKELLTGEVGWSRGTAAVGYRRSKMHGSLVSGLLPAVVLLLLLQDTHSVYIQYQGFQVQLESVKKLSDLEGRWGPRSYPQTQSLAPSVCHHPALPPDLQPVCASKEADSVFEDLKSIAKDNCELCVNVACTGCL
ncbi:guanylate cyclase activator 2B [Callorhinus ursinus]|uniref:Guanylate cyclase activator 2B n=1 Tax=Callorhinus ursinus TaxID=34884 RepID=A0A3Q7MZN2_CALUR|nr:guanylate cyclase activator 2B [Callorhinus ursinus]